MLVLSRRPDERIFIGNNISVVVVAVKGNTVQIGIDAPKDTLILREEVTPNGRPKKNIKKRPTQSGSKRKIKKATGRKNNKTSRLSMDATHLRDERKTYGNPKTLGRGNRRKYKS